MNTLYNPMRRWLFITFPPLAAVIFALMLTMPALASTIYNITYPVSLTVVNACNGEVVTFSGFEHDTFQFTSDGSGGIHVLHTTNFENLTGTGSYGNTYQIQGTFHDQSSVRVAYEETVTLTILVVSQGSAPNFTLREDVHITINPDGTLTEFHDHFSTTCQG